VNLLILRCTCLFFLGVVVGTYLNRGIYRLACFRRSIGPWSDPHPDAPPRHWFDRVPIFGWFNLRRESPIHGRGFWVRPMLIEIATGACFAALYWYECIYRGLAQVPPGMVPLGGLSNPVSDWTLHVQCFSHLLLISLMLVATFIDFDEQTIPDAITFPGALLALLIAAAFPTSRLIAIVRVPGGWQAEPLCVVSGCKPAGWLTWLDSPLSLIVAMMCFVGWCVAMVPWLWTTRRGFAKAVQYFLASFTRYLSKTMIWMAIVGSAGIALLWAFGNAGLGTAPHPWESLFTALAGMAAGGGLIWAVRIIGSNALGQEAMGFGDVTLMAMIGAFLGWQAALIVFFLSPFGAVIIALLQWAFTGRRDIAFGPYLCLAACFVVVKWPDVWDFAHPVFSMGMFVPGVLAVLLALMGILLIGLRWLRETIQDSFAAGDLPAQTSTDEASESDSTDEPESKVDAPADASN
jgi:prepilin signal peptidase PulO-like enzyme (type II secretory pathway)